MTSRNTRRLRRLLDLRRRQEESARQQLARSIERASEISDEVRHRSEAFEAVLRGGTEPARRSHSERIAEIAAPALMAARAAEASARHTADELRRDWDRALRRVKGLERLEEKQTTAEAERSLRAAQIELEDIVSGRKGADRP